MRHPSFSGFFRESSVVAVVSLSLFHCLTEREILGEGEAGPSSRGEAGAGATECYDALARGVNGEPCTGSFSCSSAPRPCCVWSARCVNGTLSVSEECEDCVCETDGDCPSGSWCAAGRCTPCSPVLDCVLPEVGIPRNGCTWCVPLGQCASDAECPAGTICYAGLACPPGCSSPECCFGNLCDAPSCGPPDNVDCRLVGCKDSGVCTASGNWPDCACRGGRWTCSSASPDACVAL
jgi:hypothetical protein